VAENTKQTVRAVEVLALIGSEPARKVIEKIAEGGDSPPTEAARAALHHLRQRPGEERK
jgi:hypothetical protein